MHTAKAGRGANMARKHTAGTNEAADRPLHEKLSALVDRRRKGRTDAEIAEAAGMSKSKLSQLLTGAIPDPRISTVKRLLDSLGLKFADLDRA